MRRAALGVALLVSALMVVMILPVQAHPTTCVSAAGEVLLYVEDDPDTEEVEAEGNGLWLVGTGPANRRQGGSIGGGSIACADGNSSLSTSADVYGNSLNTDSGGWCGHSRGTGVVTDSAGEHPYYYVSAGTMLLLGSDGVTPGVVGSTIGLINAVSHSHTLPGAEVHSADPLDNNSCTTGYAKHFLVTGVFVLL